MRDFQEAYKIRLSAKDLEELDARFVWHPRVSMKRWARKPLIIFKGDGAVLRDIHGMEYIDGTSGVGNAILGNCNEKIVKAVKEQVEKLVFADFYKASHIPQALLAKKLADLLP